jgi:PKD repeat protein
MLPVLKAQATATATLLDEEGIVGVAIGRDPAGHPEVVIMVETLEHEPIVPDYIEGMATDILVTGVLRAFPCSAATSDCSKPIPAGVSVGHPNISAGTLGVYVQDSQGNYFALSNNHVFADGNKASVGDPVLQPGPSDGGLASNPSHVLGPLAAFHPIVFCAGGCGSPSSTNPMDAAIVGVDAETVQAENFCGWTPQSTVLPVSQLLVSVTPLKKCGRTSGSTVGTVILLDAIVDVEYSPGSEARFDGQIITSSMASPGDSGSLMVDVQNRPTALLFAGSPDFTVGTPIQDVLDRFDVAIVDQDPQNQDPVASFTVSCLGLNCDFDASGSNDQDGTITDYDWHFGDGITGTEMTTSHAYSSGGSTTVTLTVTDNDNATHTTTGTANPTNPSPSPPPPQPLPPPPPPPPPPSTSEMCPEDVVDPGFEDLADLSIETTRAVACLVHLEISLGTSSTTFSPQQSVTRWEMALFLIRMASVQGVTLPALEDFGFTDLGNLPPATQDAVNRLAALGITSGTTPTTFQPTGEVSRWQMALFLTRLAGRAGVTLPVLLSDGFIDLGDLSVEARLAVRQLAALDVAKGTSPTTFDPTSHVSRWQMALFLVRQLEIGAT